MNLIKRLKTLWILSGWDIKSSKKEGSFTIDGIVRPQNAEQPRKLAQIIKKQTATDKFLQELKNE